jgi:hypothetical protein
VCHAPHARRPAALLRRPHPARGPDRRALSALGAGFGPPDLLAREERRPPAARNGKAKGVLLLYLHGGAPTQEMFDMKPTADASRADLVAAQP